MNHDLVKVINLERFHLRQYGIYVFLSSQTMGVRSCVLLWEVEPVMSCGKCVDPVLPFGQLG